MLRSEREHDLEPVTTGWVTSLGQRICSPALHGQNGIMVTLTTSMR
jgi:hypothetical protein